MSGLRPFISETAGTTAGAERNKNKERERERERSNNEIMDYRAHAIYIYSVRSKFMAGLLPNRGTYLGVNLVGIGIIKMSIPKISMYIDQTILLPLTSLYQDNIGEVPMA